MISRRQFAASAAAAACLSACAKSEDTAGGTPGELRFSVLSTETAQNMESYWRPILADMARQTGLKVTPYFSNNYTLLIEAMRFNKTDAGWFSNLSGLEAVRQGGGEVFARTFDPTGRDGYRSVLIVPAKSNLTLAKILSQMLIWRISALKPSRPPRKASKPSSFATARPSRIATIWTCYFACSHGTATEFRST